jgi:DNA-binding NtrC family response regulator
VSKAQSVLIVDDDEGLAQIVALILRQEGFETRTACGGPQGCAAYFREPTEWVVTDIQMPEVDGLRMMQNIRAFHPEVRAIYMSGEIERYHELLVHEMTEFDARVLAKPFTKKALLEQITTQQEDATRGAEFKSFDSPQSNK